MCHRQEEKKINNNNEFLKFLCIFFRVREVKGQQKVFSCNEPVWRPYILNYNSYLNKKKSFFLLKKSNLYYICKLIIRLFLLAHVL